MLIFVGLHSAHGWRFKRSFISVTRLRERKSDIRVNDWILDSGAYSTLLLHGGYPHGVEEYATQIKRWRVCGNMLAAVAQDYMCEPHMLERTGKTVLQHQEMTLERYDALKKRVRGTYIMPVLQGYSSEEYVRHLRMYGKRLPKDAWVGVGSVCKRNTDPEQIANVLRAVLAMRPDLRLHGFGVKTSSLRSHAVCSRLYSVDSYAWSIAARWARVKNRNDPALAQQWLEKLEQQSMQRVFFP